MSDSQDAADYPPVENDILKANTLGPEHVKVGMDVTTVDGEKVGKVKEVQAAEFLLDRAMARDLWVPYSFVLATEDRGGTFRRGPQQPTEVVLSISAAHVDLQQWRHA